MSLLGLAERGRLPDVIVRAGIRQLLRQRLAQSVPRDCEQRAEQEQRFVQLMDSAPIALQPASANVQHYEVPSSFFELVMGRHLKYSCCLYEDPTVSLSDAEEAMLGRTAARAQLEDGQSVLELGCGWGSLTLWMARHFGGSRITAVSNSAGQKRFIDDRARDLGLDNVRVITADMNDFETPEHFDRVVSVEMFEHMRNWRALFERVHRWLNPGGKLFFHVFCHRCSAYEFNDSGSDDDWMARHFFTGGMMPSSPLALRFQDHLHFERYFAVNGVHYSRTCEDWLRNLDGNAGQATQVLERLEPEGGAEVQLQRWRMFFMACSELFAFNGGNEWHVGHYRFTRPARGPTG